MSSEVSGLANAVVQLQAHYHHCGEAASEKCLSAATFVRQPGHGALSRLRYPGVETTRTHSSNTQSISPFDLRNQAQGTMSLLRPRSLCCCTPQSQTKHPDR